MGWTAVGVGSRGPNRTISKGLIEDDVEIVRGGVEKGESACASIACPTRYSPQPEASQ